MNEQKVARICWNSNKWQFPSGKAGKVANGSSGAYETKTGYGHEEWLFDVSKLVNGFHYAFIQAIDQHRATYEGKKFDISFYSINSTKKERWWLGEIHNVQVVSASESKSVYNKYKKAGWLKEMYAQLEAVGADVNEFKKIEPEGFCCIKFRPHDMKLLEEPKSFSANDPAVKSDYYNLKNKISNPIGIEAGEFLFTPGSPDKKGKTTATYSSHTKNIDLVHNQIQEHIYRHLCKAHGAKNVSCEQDTGYGTKIDIAVQLASGYSFYELKTSNTSKQCIREALSQLLEYSYYPNNARASKLIIVGPTTLSTESKSYLENLRKIFSLPLYYQKYDLETNNLGSEE